MGPDKLKNRRNYYRILHVQPDAPLEIIKSSYRALLLKLKQHPDLGGDTWNTVLINEAKDVLTDPVKRAEYDRHLFSTQKIEVRSGNNRETESFVFSTEKSKPHPNPSQPRTMPVCPFCRSPQQLHTFLAGEPACGRCQAPLYPAEKFKGKKSSKRTVDRFAKQFDIIYFTEWPSERRYYGQASQLSLKGMQFRTHHSLEPGQIIKIQSNCLRTIAKVVYFLPANSPGNRLENKIGIEFLTIQFLEKSGTFVSARA